MGSEGISATELKKSFLNFLNMNSQSLMMPLIFFLIFFFGRDSEDLKELSANNF